MRILIIGGNGMLGHMLLKYLGRYFDTKATLRGTRHDYAHGGLLIAENTVENIMLGPGGNLAALNNLLRQWLPNVIVNAAGVVKQRPSADDAVTAISINSLLPHQLAAMAGQIGARLIHFSTDCVFSGSRGFYTEDDLPDATNLYGRSKLLGEVSGAGCLTLRTSLVGRELPGTGGSLFEWFLSQKGPVRGFPNALFSGFTTLEMAKIVQRLITERPIEEGIWHVAASPISKYDLLVLVRERLGLRVEIVPDPSFCIDRTLNGTRFERKCSYTAPDWPTMIDEYFSFLEETGNAF
ncbi:dTDP-4-dehydrorhamnose reductase family protein [Desulfonatronum parangueonense]